MVASLDPEDEAPMQPTDPFSARYQDLLDGTYDCVDRIVLNGYWVFLQNENALEWVLEDLPEGAVCTVTLPTVSAEDEPRQPGKSGRITIEPGLCVQTVEW
jgi:hypothetical protein